MLGRAAAEETLRVGDSGMEVALGLKRPIEGFIGGVCDACGSTGGECFLTLGTGFRSLVARLEVRDGPPLGGGGLGVSTASADPPFLLIHFLSFSS